MTTAQSRALETLLPTYGCELSELADPAGIFGRRGPLYLEIGIGNGDNLLAMAARTPARDFLGCEVHRPGLGHALHRIHSERLDNVRVLKADAHDVLKALPAAALDGVYMYFPDPWPKNRHRKRRLLQARFLDVLVEKLKPSATLRFATDNRDYARAAMNAIAASPRWLNLAGDRNWAPRPKGRVVTRFEQRAVGAGRMVYELAAAPLKLLVTSIK